MLLLHGRYAGRISRDEVASNRQTCWQAILSILPKFASWDNPHNRVLGTQKCEKIFLVDCPEKRIAWSSGARTGSSPQPGLQIRYNPHVAHRKPLNRQIASKSRPILLAIGSA